MCEKVCYVCFMCLYYKMVIIEEIVPMRGFMWYLQDNQVLERGLVIYICGNNVMKV